MIIGPASKRYVVREDGAHGVFIWDTPDGYSEDCLQAPVDALIAARAAGYGGNEQRGVTISGEWDPPS